jgi:hypothetical protein
VNGTGLLLRPEAQCLHRQQAAGGLEPGTGKHMSKVTNILQQARSKVLTAATVYGDGSYTRRKHRH